MSQADHQSTANAAWKLTQDLENSLVKLSGGITAAYELAASLPACREPVNTSVHSALLWSLNRLSEHHDELFQLHEHLFHLLNPALRKGAAEPAASL